MVSRWSPSTSGPVNNWMGDRLLAAGKPSRYNQSSRSPQPSILPCRLIEYQPFWLALVAYSVESQILIDTHSGGRSSRSSICLHVNRFRGFFVTLKPLLQSVYQTLRIDNANTIANEAFGQVSQSCIYCVIKSELHSQTIRAFDFFCSALESVYSSTHAVARQPLLHT